MILHNKRLALLIGTATLLLLLPLLAMQFSDQVSWSGIDFGVAAILLFGTVLTIEFILRNIKRKEQRILLVLATLVMLLLVWAELAVGLFGTPLAGN